MKKVAFLFIAIIIAGLFTPNSAEAKPFWIKFKLGIMAKWSITFNGDCEDGRGLCLAFGGTAAPSTDPNFFGYDEETDKFYIRVFKQWTSAKPFSRREYILEENSPVDPKLVAEFPNFKDKTRQVIIKAGTYPIKDEGEYYIMLVDYFIQ